MNGGALPRELVLASAGTGKTYRLSSRIIGLLYDGAAPEQVFASTFTRKAAGEILDGVVSRIAGAGLDEDEARELSRKALLDRGGGAGTEDFGREHALALLEAIAPQFHRFEVGTLDSFFVRTSRSFWPELQLPPGWTIADDPTRTRLRSEALQDVLEEGDREERVELVRMLARGSATRRVHGRLMDQMAELHSLWRQISPEADTPWSPFRSRPDPDDVDQSREQLAERIQQAEVPANQSGNPNGHWVNARDRLARELREGDLETVLDGGLGGGALEEEFTYHGLPPTPDIEACLEDLRRLAAAELAPLYDAEAEAMGRLAERFDRAYSHRQREEGAYRFDDLTHRLAARPGLASSGDMGYRLDHRVGHLLLDEFQDTSPPQWDALRPLADRLMERRPEDSAAVIVADPKQSIYGWRGADPSLVDRVGDRYALQDDRLSESWRSSPDVLSFVNELFGDIASNRVLAEVEQGTQVADIWSEAFDRHEAAPPRADEAGYVQLDVGPEDDLGGKAPREMMSYGADRVAELHERVPDASIGVLTLTNDAVAHLIRELKARGVKASEEGGTSVRGSAPVAAVLSLLRLVDHPGDRVARYHVANTALGQAVDYRDHEEDAGARALSRRVRRKLLRKGYGETLAGWRRALGPSVSDRQDRRLRQLVELGFQWDEHATLRTTDFVHFVEAERVEEPTAAPVRVMTIHQAKGLEFDVVVLPELNGPLMGYGGPTVLPERDSETGQVLRVFPGVKQDLWPLFPEMAEADRQYRERMLRDSLSVLYVAVTRARRALHLVISASSVTPSTSAKRFSRVVLAAFGHDREDGEEGDVLLQRGDSEWHEEFEAEAEVVRGREAPAEPFELRIDPTRSIGRMVPHRAPSESEGQARDLRETLLLGRREARAEGAVVHEWCRHVGWIEEGLPQDERLLEAARRVAPSLEAGEVEGLLGSFHQWLDADEIRRVLSHEETLARASEWTNSERLEVAVQTEWPFMHRQDGAVVTGQADRLVLVRDVGGSESEAPTPSVVAAEVLDFKTDDVGGGGEQLAAAVERYRPQLLGYRRAVAYLHSIPLESVRGTLVFLRNELTVQV
jgi:ATP-dependent exoDNAse (exonuclease V) beta subunit